MNHSLKVALAMEAADMNFKELQTHSHASGEILQFLGEPKKSCYRCGRNHDKKKLPSL